MKTFKKAKKALALILTLCMVVTMIPANAVKAFGATDTTYVLAGSDFQPTDSSTTTGVNLVNGILTKIQEEYTTMDGFLFMGDYTYNYDDTSATAGKEALQGAVQAAYGTGMDEVYVQGNHDTDTVANSICSPSGANDAEDYGVFVINERDYMWYNDDETTIKNTAANLETYLNAKRNTGYTKPIFVVSHLPLHYCMRTQVGGGDGKHANYIFDVLNEAGAAGLNIIFMFGHNHSHGWDDPYGGAAIFLTKGDPINIAQNSTTTYKEETLNFTYMNAGYVAYYRNVNSGAETNLSMTTFAITDTDVTIERYTDDGLHDLKSAGVANTHASTGSSVDGSCSTNHGGKETYSPDTSTVASAYTLTLNTEITPAGEEVTVPETGTTETTLEQITSLEQGQAYVIVNDRSGTMLTNKTITYDNNGTQTTLKLEGEPAADTEHVWYYNGTNLVYGDPNSTSSYLLMATEYSYLGEAHSYRMVDDVYLNNDGATFTLKRTDDNLYLNDYGNGKGVAAPYTSDGNSDAGSKWRIYKVVEGTGTPTVDTTGGDWVTITEPTTGETTYTYELTDTIVSGEKYLIGSGNSGTVNVLNSNGNTIRGTTTNGVFTTTSSVTDAHKWTFTGSGTSYTIQNVSTGGYLYPDGEVNWRGNWSYSLETNGSSTAVTVNNNNGALTISRSVSSSTGYYNTTAYMNNSFGANNSGSAVYLYKIVEHTSEGTPGLYGKISGELTYNVAIGTSAEDAIKAVQEGITGYSSNSKDGSNATQLDDSALTWELAESYNGTTPGEYAVTIAYNGVTLGVAKVVVPSVAIDSYTINPMSATVRQGTAQSVQTGSKITVTLEDGNYYTVPVTISMLSKDGETISTAEPGTQTGLTVTYNGVVITNDYTLTVAERVVNNYPEYPDEGAVKVNKTATGIQFQSTGVAQVELSASGVPAQKGADVVVVIDTSSSMKDNDVGSTGKTRIEVLSESLEQMLQQFQTPNDNGVLPDIDIAITDFNGYYDSSAGDFDKISLSDSYRENADYAQVFTGNNAGAYIKNVGLSASDFVEVDTINATTIANYFTNENCASGTNYDGALENAYTLLAAKQAANGDEQRDSYVIFLSDGAPFRYNGYNNGSTKSTYDGWDNYLSGDYANADALENAFPNSDSLEYTYFYNGNGTNHPHRWAEAIKGTPGDTYTVISRDAASNSPAYQKGVNGLGATIYSIGFGLADDGSASDGGTVTVATQQELIEVISSGDGYNYPNVQSADELTTAFTQIVTAINYAASNARFVDQVGDDYDLKITPITDLQGNAVTDASGNTVTPKIEIIQYDIYTKADAEAGSIPSGKNVGDRKGTYTVLETVTFNDDGTEAYSNKKSGNILANGVINAQNFWYNTNTTSVMIDPDGDGNSDHELTSETFYWKVGTVTTYELAMRYYVYLEGAKEGTCQAGSYPTNEYATLYYDNYLGTPCFKDTTSPVMAWKSANVSYAFYLVNEKGEIIVNQTTGETGTFANKVAITNPVVYQEILLNNTDQIEALKVAALGENVLPTYYTVYDKDAVYTISIKSDATGEWKITQGDDIVASTYVTQYDPADASAYSNALTENGAYDYTHTTVWFAVVWDVQAHPDTVVVDYGLPVDISVLTNDMFGENGKLAGIGAYTDGIENTTASASLATDFGDSYTGKYGTAVTKDDKVRYTPTSMEMNGYDQFAYAVHYTGTTNPGYYYDTVTVIPATTIYYEDDFMTYTESNTEWVDEGTAVVGATQDEDRPGAYSLTDANNIYGYDSVNKGMSTFSLGTAKKVHVDADSYATAEFTFCGTGFDIIGMTSNTTGTIAVTVTDAEGKTVGNKVVDTYYGYKQDGEGNWIVDTGSDAESNNSLYQVPVMQAENLDYGKYTVKITATYVSPLDKTTDDGYDLYLDAVRIYDPANDGAADGTDDKTIEDAYKTDGEGWPSYIELRNKIIAANSFDKVANDALTTDMEGLVFIDGDASVGNAQISDYISYGPNNEIYLAPGQRVAFILNTPDNVAKVHLGVKSADGNTGTYTITNIAQAANEETGLKAGDYYAAKTATVDTTTDMYYDITGYKGDIIVVSNTGERYGTEGVISLTNIKSTYTSDPNGTVTVNGGTGISMASAVAANETSIYMTPAAAALTLRSLNTSEEPETPVTPEEPEVVIEKAAINSVKADKEAYTVKDTATVTVETNTAAEYVTVNGNKITEFTEADGVRTWTYTEKAAKTGEMTFIAVAYNEEDEASESASATVTVKKFAPKTFRLAVNKTSVTVGDKVKATVTTGTDVKYVTINGKKVTKFVYNKAKGTRTWKSEVKTTKVGKLTLKAVAYNKNDSASKQIIKNVTVKRYAPKIFKVTLSKSKVKTGAKYTVTVKTGSTAKYVKVNGKKLTKYTYNKKNATKTFKITYKAGKPGKKTVKVIAYNKAGYATKAKTKTVTVTKR